ncbi:MAG: DUF1801 domain-containing protein [Deltaproteobacteria bacterium]|nr:DUF1801 domain-containing protein [Deltaproteobacteria bacterium]
MTKTDADTALSATELIDRKIADATDWRGKTLAQLRAVVRSADPEVTEELKWRRTPVWYCDGMLTTGETHTHTVKMTFAKGAALRDPEGLFNASLEGNVRRAIDFREGDAVPESALRALVREAIVLNRAGKKKKNTARKDLDK